MREGKDMERLRQKGPKMGPERKKNNVREMIESVS